LPDEEEVDLSKAAKEWVEVIKESKSLDLLKEAYIQAYGDLKKDKVAVELISKAKDYQKGILMALQA